MQTAGRLRYRTLEQPRHWTEENKDCLAQEYARLKEYMLSKIGERMAIPWRAAEDLHWQLGEQELIRRAASCFRTIGQEPRNRDTDVSPSEPLPGFLRENERILER
ncbi:hypothetical protein N7510_002661 [Penicillium lagena]|uniref:uncharacterized protein n=1 Tax=Penicillium lagena TaxID=94218 RepID=UPI0025407A03|nr:uncharacterized protein N7510_002661 [Penicillium lagena]KAJ5626352.1 hypothetical protein N7510_002661 [Penicillium lagena]